MRGNHEPPHGPGHQHPSDHQSAPGHQHAHGAPSAENPQSRFRWQVHHPFDGVPARAAIEVAPWSGLLPRWRFVIPAEYEGVVSWGVGKPNGGAVSFADVRRPIRHGPVQLTNGPVVEWFGGHNPLSQSLSAYLVIDGDPPHYLAFGQSPDQETPPGSLEGVYFNAHHHPDAPSP